MLLTPREPITFQKVLYFLLFKLVYITASPPLEGVVSFTYGFVTIDSAIDLLKKYRILLLYSIALNPQEGWVVAVRGVCNETPESKLGFNNS